MTGDTERRTMDGVGLSVVLVGLIVVAIWLIHVVV